jgi:hypothetical protein
MISQFDNPLEYRLQSKKMAANTFLPLCPILNLSSDQ